MRLLRSLYSQERIGVRIENDPLDADALYVMHARCYSIWSELVESTYECRQPAGQIDFAPLKQLLARLA